MENNEKYKDIKGSRIGSDIIDYFVHVTIAEIISTFFVFIYIILFTQEIINSSNSNANINEYSGWVNYSALIGSVTSIIVVFIYYTVIPYLTKGATLGKLAVKLRIVNDDYSRCSFKTLLKRNIRLYVEILGIIPSILAITGVIDIGSYIIYAFLAGMIKFVIYISIFSQISRDKLPFHDSFSNTMVVHKMYNPNVENYKTITEISNWADVVGIDKNIAINSNISTENKGKEDDENNFWGE